MVKRFVACVLTVLLLAGGPGARAGEGFVEANGLKFHYVDSGDGPPVLLLHGGSLTLHSWDELRSKASSNFHVYAYDSRGQGETLNPEGKFSYKLLAQDAASVIKALHLDHPAVVGYSDGGVTALELAVEHPELLRAVVVGGATNKIAADAHYFHGLRGFFGSGKPGALTDADLDGLAASQPETAKFYAQIHHRSDNPDYWRVMLKQIWPMWTTKFVVPDEKLRRIKTPMLILLADHDDFSEPRDAVAMERLITGSELGILPGATHTVFHDHPDLFDAMVLQFLDAHKR